MARKEYEMTQDQLDTLLKSMQSAPLIMLQCGPMPNLQERANAAWKRLGDEMGFDHMSVQPTRQGDRFFTAEPK